MSHLLNYILYSNIVISLGCGMLTMGISHINGLNNITFYGIFAFLGTFIVYNFHRFVKLNQEKYTSPMTDWMRHHRLLIMCTWIVCSSGFFVLLFQDVNWSFGIILLGAIVLFCSVFYIVKVGGINLRELPFLKAHLISMSWIAIISFFPLLNEQEFGASKWMFGATHYFYLLATCIPFDIRDLDYDKPSQKTIPQLLGIQASKAVACLLIVTFYILSVFVKKELGNTNLFLGCILLQVLWIYFVTKKKQEFYYNVLIDGNVLLLGCSYFSC